MNEYQIIYADPPWEQKMMPVLKRRPQTAGVLPYPTMSLQEIMGLPIEELAGEGCHLWLWATNAFLHDAFHVIETWGFKYMMVITWVMK